MEELNRVEEAYARFIKVFGEQEEGHPATLDFQEVKRLVDMGRHFSMYEKDAIYLTAFYSYGAGYMLGFSEGTKLK